MSYYPQNLKHGQIRQEVANKLLKGNASQCWCSPQEMKSAKKGDHPHGYIDECTTHDEKPWFRVWNNNEGVWLNEYAS